MPHDSPPMGAGWGGEAVFRPPRYSDQPPCAGAWFLGPVSRQPDANAWRLILTVAPCRQTLRRSRIVEVFLRKTNSLAELALQLRSPAAGATRRADLARRSLRGGRDESEPRHEGGMAAVP